MAKDVETQAVLDVAKDQGDEKTYIYTLESGVRVRIKPIPAAVIDEVTSRIPQPVVPVWHNAEYDRDEENPNDPAYLRAIEDYDRKRGSAMIDAVVMFGIELIDGLPADETWFNQLMFAQKMGLMDLSRFNMNDLVEKEYVFKRYHVATIGMIVEIQELSAVRPEEIERARRNFRR